MLRNVPHDGSSHHRFPYKMITILLTTFLKLYRRSPSSYKINKPVGNLEKFGISQRRGWDLILSQRCWHSCHFHRAQLFTCGCVTRMYKHTSIIRDLCVHTEVLPENSAAQDVGMKGTGWRGHSYQVTYNLGLCLPWGILHPGDLAGVPWDPQLPFRASGPQPSLSQPGCQPCFFLLGWGEREGTAHADCGVMLWRHTHTHTPNNSAPNGTVFMFTWMWNHS